MLNGMREHRASSPARCGSIDADAQIIALMRRDGCCAGYELSEPTS